MFPHVIQTCYPKEMYPLGPKAFNIIAPVEPGWYVLCPVMSSSLMAGCFFLESSKNHIKTSLNLQSSTKRTQHMDMVTCMCRYVGVQNPSK